MNHGQVQRRVAVAELRVVPRARLEEAPQERGVASRRGLVHRVQLLREPSGRQRGRPRSESERRRDEGGRREAHARLAALGGLHDDARVLGQELLEP